jgi:hypothetical protein
MGGGSACQDFERMLRLDLEQKHQALAPHGRHRSKYQVKFAVDSWGAFLTRLDTYAQQDSGPPVDEDALDFPVYRTILGQLESECAGIQHTPTWPPDKKVTSGTMVIDSRSLYFDEFLQQHYTRPSCVRLLRNLDLSGVNTRFFLGQDIGHLFLQNRFTGRAKIYRDFVQCTPMPRYTGPLGSGRKIHIKTNIPAKSDIMYRFAIEGYNYGNNSIINCDCVGYTHKQWEMLGKSEEYGWPDHWDRDTINHYSPGAELSQYYSSDHFVALRLKAPSFFCVGFSMSAWLVCHSYGADFPISATIHHQEDNL